MKKSFAALVPLALAACAPLEPLPAGAELTGSTAVATPAPSGPTVGWAGYRVRPPEDWRGVNDAQTGN